MERSIDGQIYYRKMYHYQGSQQVRNMPQPLYASPYDMTPNFQSEVYNKPTFPSNMVSLPYGATSQSQSMVPISPLAGSCMFMDGYGQNGYPGSQIPSLLPYSQPQMTPPGMHNFYYRPNNSAGSNIDQMNLSRTVMLKNLSEELTLHELLSEIDFGPIEYCRMFSRPAPSHFKDINSLKMCYICFVSSKISVHFQLKYSQKDNFNDLKKRLKNSRYLKVALNDSMGLNTGGFNKMDYLKMRTLNYICDLNATRCIRVKVEPHMENKNALDSEICEELLQFGEIEDLVARNESNSDAKVYFIHFVSIYMAIKAYDHLMSKISKNKLELISSFIESSLGKEKRFIYRDVIFSKDRCDRSPVEEISKDSAPESSYFKQNLSEDGSANEKFLDGSYDDSSETVDKEGNRSSDLINDVLENSSFQSTSVGALNEYGSIKSSAPLGDYWMMNNSQSSVNNLPFPASPFFSHQGISSSSLNPEALNMGNRSIYLGNLHPRATIEEIANNVRSGGLLESIKHFPERRICFITFIDPSVALKFYLNHRVLHQLVIHGEAVTVGWARNHSGPLNRDIGLAVTAGASRNVYMGLKPKKDNHQPGDGKRSLPDETTLRSDFSKFGDLEQINFFHNGDCGFMNFLRITDAIKVVDLFTHKNIDKISKIAGDRGEFFYKYQDFRISFGKDRCGNPPKFNYKKHQNRQYDRKAFNEEQESDGLQNTGDERDNCINEEAALVFGISTDLSQTNQVPETGDNSSPNKEVENSKKDDKNENIGDEYSFSLSDSKEDNKRLQGSHSDYYDEHLNSSNGKSKDENIGENDDEYLDKFEAKYNEFEEKEDDDDEEDVSIIVGSNDASISSLNDPPKGSVHSRKNKKKISSSGDSRSSSKTGSNVSLPVLYLQVPRNNLHHDAVFFTGSPTLRPQRYHQMQNSQKRVPYGNNYSSSEHGPTPNTTQNRNACDGSSKAFYSMSGSQVMAQYLAKAQQDNILYSASLLPSRHDVDDNRFTRKLEQRGDVRKHI